MTKEKKIQRPFLIKPNSWVKFQKRSLELGKSSSSRIEEFIESENKYNKVKK